MRRMLLLPFLLITLAGCATSGSSAPPPVTPTQVSNVIVQVQDKVRQGCAVAVQTKSVADILSALGVPYVGMVADIANQVCNAFNRTGARRGLGGPTLVVRGQVIKLKGTRVAR